MSFFMHKEMIKSYNENFFHIDGMDKLLNVMIIRNSFYNIWNVLKMFLALMIILTIVYNKDYFLSRKKSLFRFKCNSCKRRK